MVNFVTLATLQQMDLIFQSGEFINDESPFYAILSIAVNLLGILAGAMVSIIVFRNGIRVEKRKEETRLKEVEHYVSNMILLLSDPIEKQIKELSSLCDRLTLEVEEHYTMEKIVTVHLNSLKEIPHSDLYRIFVINKTGSIAER